MSGVASILALLENVVGKEVEAEKDFSEISFSFQKQQINESLGHYWKGISV